ncbi:hypothetical protein QCM77_23965 [Bradyrhizobium sp. SSUT18]|uniref:hypothetical protein n=1 Tax=Bradyrhizobium sp. SSUT18 TaxID=3040602 RepID=UPI0024491814|nr:hypothetical protein [Bradyrhizobium sp. SSUT18]MDH2402989.1 hypothetical protein [Bradyrhizobium sp. SSUT18]
MFEFTLEWASRRSVVERAIDARAVTDRLHIREAFIFPLVLLVTFLIALGIMTGAHLHGRADGALPYLVSGGMGMPMLYPASASCRRPSDLGSAPRLRQADVLSLLAVD